MGTFPLGIRHRSLHKSREKVALQSKKCKLKDSSSLQKTQLVQCSIHTAPDTLASLARRKSSNLSNSCLVPSFSLGIPGGLVIVRSFGTSALCILPWFISRISSFEDVSLDITSTVRSPDSNASNRSADKK